MDGRFDVAGVRCFSGKIFRGSIGQEAYEQRRLLSHFDLIIEKETVIEELLRISGVDDEYCDEVRAFLESVREITDVGVATFERLEKRVER